MTLLQHPVFRRLYAAHIVHIIGNEFTFIAVVGLLDIRSGLEACWRVWQRAGWRSA
ncbi:hypothetical protein ABE205_06025 [Brevibacillus agri]|uniref:hypothetical protein n=1 Tax=Brevibacillus agri TaxID=51101 RepID=UPI003D1B4F35